MSPSANITTNGYADQAPETKLHPGVYVPTVAFFTSDDKIDTVTTTQHAVRLAKAGVAGLVTHGSNGEAVHLDHSERSQITHLTRSALDSAGYAHLPLIVGCGAQSTRETIQLCKEASRAGGSHVLILPPSYYGALLSTDLIIEHFCAVADASPLPLVIYNFPGACSGLDLSSDTVLVLAAHPKIVGVKLTCGDTGKLARVVAGTKNTGFGVFGGSADFVLPTLSVGGHGVIAGLANIAPEACVELMRRWRAGKMEQARWLQEVVARGDWVAIQAGFVGVKVALQKFYGYGGLPRRPCVLPKGEKLASQEAGFSELVEAEKGLAGA